MLNAVPCALITRFFLAPDDFFRLAVAFDLRLEFFMRKRIQLLKPDNRHVGYLLCRAMRDKIIINFSAAHDDSAHFVGINRFSFGNDRAKHAFGQFFET